MIIKKIQEFCLHLDHLVHKHRFHQEILYCQKYLIQNFHMLKYGLLLKICIIAHVKLLQKENSKTINSYWWYNDIIRNEMKWNERADIYIYIYIYIYI